MNTIKEITYTFVQNAAEGIVQGMFKAIISKWEGQPQPELCGRVHHSAAKVADVGSRQGSMIYSQLDRRKIHVNTGKRQGMTNSGENTTLRKSTKQVSSRSTSMQACYPNKT